MSVYWNQTKIGGSLRAVKRQSFQREGKCRRGHLLQGVLCSQDIVYNWQLVFMLRSFCSDSRSGKQNQPSSTLLKMDFHVRVVWFDLACETWSQNFDLFWGGNWKFFLWSVWSVLWSVTGGVGVCSVFSPLLWEAAEVSEAPWSLFSPVLLPSFTKLILSMATGSSSSELESPRAGKWWERKVGEERGGRESSETSEMRAVVNFQIKRDWNLCLCFRPDQCSHHSVPV